MTKQYYMHYSTTSIGTKDDFIHGISDEELMYEEFEDAVSLFDKYVETGILLPVELN